MNIFKRFFNRLFPKKDPFDDWDAQLPNCNEIIVQNIIDMTLFALKRARRINDTKKFETTSVSSIMKITSKNGDIYDLDLGLYIHHNDSRMTEKKYENESLVCEAEYDIQYVREEVEKRSTSLFEK